MAASSARCGIRAHRLEVSRLPDLPAQPGPHGIDSRCKAWLGAPHQRRKDAACGPQLRQDPSSSASCASRSDQQPAVRQPHPSQARGRHRSGPAAAVVLGGQASVGGNDGEGGGGGGRGRSSGGGSGGGGAGDGPAEGSSGDEQEHGRILSTEEVERLLAAEGVQLPEDMAAAAALEGLPEKILHRFLMFQTATGPVGFLFRGVTSVRNRLLADDKFLFKVFTEVAVDTGCATVAEVQKRGDDFWAEFELYMSDLLVGLALDVALVGMLAPVASFAAHGAPARGLTAGLSRHLAALPSSMFEAAGRGRSFSVGQRVACYLVKGGQYAVVGTGCGLVGQGIANAIMTLKRRMKPADEHAEQVKVPPLMKSAALWGVFMGVSSNTRYQIINGLERLVEHSPMTRKFPVASNAFTVAIRFGNNVFGGMQFVDWARLAGVQ
ncbi:reticulata-related 1 [Klebsormidium nitens]|uniref:Reticulata-related 1 n=1 Tax=Klebsormidium nitens TaxID=105231 RepID=A0A1Y1IJU1_KLENI|nr:reticulata-related 1 [Klebsormidium nitens]|eukprot:GAQ90993.1 reticulata-related 1 [Klebsormidium nitens]